MSSPTFDAVLGGLGNKTVEALKLTLAASWDSFTDEEKVGAEKLMFSLAKAHLLELAGYDVSEPLRILDAAFAQWKVVGKQVVIDGARKVAGEVFGYAGAFAGGLVSAFVKSVV